LSTVVLVGRLLVQYPQLQPALRTLEVVGGDQRSELAGPGMMVQASNRALVVERDLVEQRGVHRAERAHHGEALALDDLARLLRRNGLQRERGQMALRVDLGRGVDIPAAVAEQ